MDKTRELSYKEVAGLVAEKYEVSSDKLENLAKDLKGYGSKKPHNTNQIILAGYLLSKRYNVDVEFSLKDIMETKKVGNLKGDLLGLKEENGRLFLRFIEVETGHVPAERFLKPWLYRRARDSAKAARYFFPYEILKEKLMEIYGLKEPEEIIRRYSLSTVGNYTLQVPSFYRKTPENRKEKEIKKEKDLLDRFYKSPSIPEVNIEKSGPLDSFLTITPSSIGSKLEVNEPLVKEIPAEKYLRENEERILNLEEKLE